MEYEGTSIREWGSLCFLDVLATRCITHTVRTRIEWLRAVGRVDEIELIGIRSLRLVWHSPQAGK